MTGLFYTAPPKQTALQAWQRANEERYFDGLLAVLANVYLCVELRWQHAEQTRADDALRATWADDLAELRALGRIRANVTAAAQEES